LALHGASDGRIAGGEVAESVIEVLADATPVRRVRGPRGAVLRDEGKALHGRGVAVEVLEGVTIAVHAHVVAQTFFPGKTDKRISEYRACYHLYAEPQRGAGGLTTNSVPRIVTSWSL
jgi:hypothetical protein